MIGSYHFEKVTSLAIKSCYKNWGSTNLNIYQIPNVDITDKWDSKNTSLCCKDKRRQCRFYYDVCI